MKDLNCLKIDHHYGIDHPDIIQSDFSFSGPVKFDTVSCYFKFIEERLIELIEQNKDNIILGCVAWLTSERILKALSKCRAVQIVVQKEDFLRPDGINNNWKRKLNGLYNDLKFPIHRMNMGGLASELSICGDPGVESIRCVGNHNSEKNPAFPRSHHKFLVFCKEDSSLKQDEYFVTEIGDPFAVWTGSFNLTQNATRSFENVILMKDYSGKNPIINSYLNEYYQIFALSEQLNWEDDWCAPEYRLGT